MGTGAIHESKKQCQGDQTENEHKQHIQQGSQRQPPDSGLHVDGCGIFDTAVSAGRRPANNPENTKADQKNHDNTGNGFNWVGFIFFLTFAKQFVYLGQVFRICTGTGFNFVKTPLDKMRNEFEFLD